MGTEQGLARFDGHEVKLYSRADYPEFDPDEVWSLAEDGAGRLWDVGPTLAFSWDGSRMRFESRLGSLEKFSDSPRRVFQTTDGLVHGVGTRGLFRLAGEGIGYHPLPNRGSIPGGAVAQSKDGKLWVGSLGLREFDPGTGHWTLHPLPEALSSNDEGMQIYGIHPHPLGGWIVVFARWIQPFVAAVWHFGEGNQGWTPLVTDLPGNLGRPFFSFVDRHGHLWMPGGDQGLIRLTFDATASPGAGSDVRDASRLRPRQMAGLRVPWGVPSDFAVCALEDRDGSLWVSAERSGLHMFRPKPIHTLGVEEGLPHTNVWSVLATEDGSVWVGTEGGLAQFEVNSADGKGVEGSAVGSGSSLRQRSTFHREDGLSFEAVRALGTSPDGTLWVGTARGLDLVRGGKFLHQWFPPHLPRHARIADPQEVAWNKYRVIQADRSGTMWLGVAAGLHRIRDDQDIFLANELAPTRDVRAVLQTRDGALWVGLDGEGLVRLPAWLASSPTIEPADLVGSPFNVAITTRFPQLRGSNSAGSSNTPPESARHVLTGGAMIPTRERLLTLTVTNGLSSNHIWVLHEDADGVLWVGTESGLNRVALAPRSVDGPGTVGGEATSFRVTSFSRRQGCERVPDQAAFPGRAFGFHPEGPRRGIRSLRGCGQARAGEFPSIAGAVSELASIVPR